MDSIFVSATARDPDLRRVLDHWGPFLVTRPRIPWGVQTIPMESYTSEGRMPPIATQSVIACLLAFMSGWTLAACRRLEGCSRGARTRTKPARSSAPPKLLGRFPVAAEVRRKELRGDMGVVVPYRLQHLYLSPPLSSTPPSPFRCSPRRGRERPTKEVTPRPRGSTRGTR